MAEAEVVAEKHPWRQGKNETITIDVDCCKAPADGTPRIECALPLEASSTIVLELTLIVGFSSLSLATSHF